MDDIKTVLNFSDGEIYEIVKYDMGISSEAVLVEKVKFFLSDYIMKHKLSGDASIEAVGGELYVGHHVLPKRFAAQLDRMLSERYHAKDKDRPRK